MESEGTEWENPVAYWRQRSRRALESQGVVLPPSPSRVIRYHPPRNVLREARIVRIRAERIGLDVICNDCGQHISKSTITAITCHFYAPDQGPPGSPLTRCSFRCPICSYKLVLGRNIGDVDNFVVIAGATQHFPASDAVPDSDPNLQNEAYPDAVLDSPNDFPARQVIYGEVMRK